MKQQEKKNEELKVYFFRFKKRFLSFFFNLKIRRVLIFLSIFVIIFSFFFSQITTFFKKTLIGPKTAFSLLTADTSSLNSSNGRINLLVLGIGGENHEAIDLTDTIIFASIDKNSADTVMLSVPRDIWVDPLKTKVNAVYHYGEERAPGEGFVLAKDAIQKVLNQPVNYAILIDFEGFIRLIDLLEGIEVKVDRSFDDYKYPIPGKERDECDGDWEFNCRYEHIHFEAGWQHMDGKKSLKFVRSRNAKGEEGTDFARSQRQQKLILALAQRIFSYKTIFSPNKIKALKENFGDHVKFDTQLKEDQITAFLSLFIRFVKNKNEIRTISLDTGSKDNPGFLYNPPIEEYDQWVLVPRLNDWTEVHKYIREKIYKGY
ncbi:hypothetical protein COT75_02215 [Candidatus Beckwithbacteria bacterium CG10_big_fil_rev_8_21_14_0_10_34_10]|uniref:Cell envelope-related transcriptional attenuator domain-containing protein n=1 Tax=Candidatus Beckwithbacteria bacterium CG10_big_fil_rev_8_21_14_0_10_34_10 TaxID=1974495 RepID=A0A2H0WBJ2_9BACT|nr:MAG: hypothetical protein COT75_02215 [Candidatus Beckwithbacteria bacterium CG10_big_fil_rev_8_21_14_0_10_34_10]